MCASWPLDISNSVYNSANFYFLLGWTTVKVKGFGTKTGEAGKSGI